MEAWQWKDAVLSFHHPYPSPYSSLFATPRILVILFLCPTLLYAITPFNRHTERKEMLTVFAIAMRYFCCSYFYFWEPLGSWVRSVGLSLYSVVILLLLALFYISLNLSYTYISNLTVQLPPGFILFFNISPIFSDSVRLRYVYVPCYPS